MADNTPVSMMQDRPPTIVLLHGWAGHPTQYEKTARAIEQETGLRVVTPLLPVVTDKGMKWRPTPQETATIPGCAQELQPILPDDRVIIVGHSLGGGVAIALANLALPKLDGLILISPVGGDPQFSLKSWMDMIAGSRDEARSNADWEPQVRRSAIRTLMRHPVATTRMAVTGKHSNLTHPLQRVIHAGVPVTIIVPERDRIVRTGALATVDGVNVRTVSGNHGWPINEPDRVAEEIESALRAISQKQTTVQSQVS